MALRRAVGQLRGVLTKHHRKTGRRPSVRQ